MAQFKVKVFDLCTFAPYSNVSMKNGQLHTIILSTQLRCFLVKLAKHLGIRPLTKTSKFSPGSCYLSIILSEVYIPAKSEQLNVPDFDSDNAPAHIGVYSLLWR